jgi:hypothetical protein
MSVLLIVLVSMVAYLVVGVWRSKRYDGTPAEREMASELARMCEERAREVDL